MSFKAITYFSQCTFKSKIINQKYNFTTGRFAPAADCCWWCLDKACSYGGWWCGVPWQLQLALTWRNRGHSRYQLACGPQWPPASSALLTTQTKFVIYMKKVKEMLVFKQDWCFKETLVWRYCRCYTKDSAAPTQSWAIVYSSYWHSVLSFRVCFEAQT